VTKEICSLVSHSVYSGGGRPLNKSRRQPAGKRMSKDISKGYGDV